MINALMTSVYNALKGDASLMTQLSGTLANGYRCYHVTAPQDSTVDSGDLYLVFGLISGVPMGTFESVEAMEDATFYVNIWSSSGSAKEVGTTFGLVDDVLNDASLTVTGFTCMKCIREYIGSILWDDVTRKWLMPVRYRAWLDKN